MPNYRRFLEPGATYFFTIVTADRVPLFHEFEASRLLGACLREVRGHRPFVVTAIVLLPDHLHMIWSLPRGDSDYSTRIGAMKASFSRAWLERGNGEQPVTNDQARQRRRGVWQPRFLEHMIRDEQDLGRHVDYIHYNPVKHGRVSRPADWPCSSFLRFVRRGDYPLDWGRNAESVVVRGVDETLLE